VLSGTRRDMRTRAHALPTRTTRTTGADIGIARGHARRTGAAGMREGGGTSGGIGGNRGAGRGRRLRGGPRRTMASRSANARGSGTGGGGGTMHEETGEARRGDGAEGGVWYAMLLRFRKTAFYLGLGAWCDALVLHAVRCARMDNLLFVADSTRLHPSEVAYYSQFLFRTSCCPAIVDFGYPPPHFSAHGLCCVAADALTSRSQGPSVASQILAGPKLNCESSQIHSEQGHLGCMRVVLLLVCNTLPS